MTGPTKFPRSAMTKLLLICVLILAAALPGCGWTKRQFTGSTSPAPIAKSVEPSAKVIVTPDVSLAAKVILVNLEGRYVILNFPSGELPRLQQTLFLYRDGLKMAEVKITDSRFAMENAIVADIIAGNAQVGDIVRDE